MVAGLQAAGGGRHLHLSVPGCAQLPGQVDKPFRKPFWFWYKLRGASFGGVNLIGTLLALIGSDADRVKGFLPRTKGCSLVGIIGLMIIVIVALIVLQQCGNCGNRSYSGYQAVYPAGSQVAI